MKFRWLMVRACFEKEDAAPKSVITRIRPLAAPSGTVAVIRVAETCSALARTAFFAPGKATQAAVLSLVPVIWIDPPGETSRIFEHPVRQIMSEISGGSGSTSPPPVVAAWEGAPANVAVRRQAKIATKAANESGFWGLGFNLFRVRLRS